MICCLISLADRGRLQAAAKRRRQRAFRPGTVANHYSIALLYVAFTIYFSLQDFPAATTVLLMYAEFLLRSYGAGKSTTNALSALRTFHLIYGFDTIGFDDYQLALWKRALPLTVRNAPSPAPPFTLSLLVKVCRRALSLGGRGLAFAALVATGFFSLARLSSLLPARRNAVDQTRVPLLED